MVDEAAARVAVNARWPALIVFLGTTALFVRGSAAVATPGDAGELIAAAHTLSLPHSPSFPLFVLLSKFFISAIPFGAVSYRVVLFSAVCASAATTVLFLLLLKTTSRLWASFFCALAISLTAPLWLNAIVAEVFALHRLSLEILLLVILASAATAIRPEAGAVMFGFLGGLFSGNHQTIVFAAPAYLVFAWMIRPWQRFVQTTAVAFAFSILGLTLYLTLPIRSAKDPPLDWGNPTTASRFLRTVTRKDYGTLTLALGEQPERTIANAGRQIARFSRHLLSESGWPVLLMGIIGLGYGTWKRQPLAAAGGALFLFSGPAFFLLGNLPFDAQSEGVMHRFYIAPIVALGAGCATFILLAPRAAVVLGVAGVVIGLGNASVAAAHRNHRIVSDTAQSMLRALPPNGTLFLDGGDDAFYGLATELYVNQRRPDVKVHDRGGLIFPSPYGPDFRGLTREEKSVRRESIEKTRLSGERVFYLTMNENVMPGVPLKQRSFIYEAAGGGDGFDWPLAVVRGVYPPPTDDYRTRALAAFFPYMRGVEIVDENPEAGLRSFRRASVTGFDTQWLDQNLSHMYEVAGHRLLTEERFALARRAFLDAIDFDGGTELVFNNMGVVSEREGNLAEAAEWYRETARRYPRSADAVYNLAVLSWKRADWKAAADHFAEALRRRPDHPTAARFLNEAKRRFGESQ